MPSSPDASSGQSKPFVPKRSFFARPAEDLAPELLNKVLVHGAVSGRIVEVEAYAGSQDPASHAFRGPTPRNEVMFGPAGHLYVYFTYGMHFCANVVCGEEGAASAILIRALAPLTGIEEMRVRRGPRPDRDLASGPAKLCQAMGIGRALNGADLVSGQKGVNLLDDGVKPPAVQGRSSRVGIKVGIDHQWRWWVPGDENVSRGRAST